MIPSLNQSSQSLAVTQHPHMVLLDHTVTLQKQILCYWYTQVENSSMTKGFSLDKRWLNLGVQTQRQLWVYSLNLTLAPQATSWSTHLQICEIWGHNRREWPYLLEPSLRGHVTPSLNSMTVTSTLLPRKVFYSLTIQKVNDDISRDCAQWANVSLLLYTIFMITYISIRKQLTKTLNRTLTGGASQKPLTLHQQRGTPQDLHLPSAPQNKLQDNCNPTHCTEQPQTIPPPQQLEQIQPGRPSCPPWNQASPVIS